MTVETQFAEAGRSSFKVDHRLFKDGALAVEGFETRVWVRWQSDDRRRLKSHPIPAEVLARFAGA